MRVPRRTPKGQRGSAQRVRRGSDAHAGAHALHPANGPSAVNRTSNAAKSRQEAEASHSDPTPKKPLQPAARLSPVALAELLAEIELAFATQKRPPPKMFGLDHRQQLLVLCEYLAERTEGL